MRNLVLALTGVLTLATTNCMAISLDQARSNGVVCEDSLGFVQPTGGGADVTDMTVSINAQRLKAYQQQARDKGVPVQQVQKAAAKRLQSSSNKGC